MGGTSLLSRASSIPLYLQLQSLLREKITSGEWRSGDQMPSEAELMSQYGVSRGTARRALEALAREGLISIEQGRGTFVSGPKLDLELAYVYGFGEDVSARGLEVSVDLIGWGRILPSPGLREKLPGAVAVYWGERLARIGKDPVILENVYLDAGAFKVLERSDFTKVAFYEHLKSSYGIDVERTKKVFQITFADDHQAELLQCNVGAALMQVERVSYYKGTPFEYKHSVLRGDRCRFLLDLDGHLRSAFRRI